MEALIQVLNHYHNNMRKTLLVFSELCLVLHSKEWPVFNRPVAFLLRNTAFEEKHEKEMVAED